MAQSGFTPIQIYYSTTTSNVPTAGNLADGELAINTADGKLFYKDNGGVVRVIAQTSSVTNVSSISFGSTGLTPSTATTGAVTVAGTLATGNGGTGLTTFSANQVFYASSTSAVGQSSNLTFDGSNLQVGSRGDVRFGDSDNSNWVALQAPATVASNVTFSLPSADGTNGQAIITDGSGNLSFGNAGITTGKSIAMAMIFGF